MAMPHRQTDGGDPKRRFAPEVCGRSASRPLGFSIRGDLLYLRLNLFHSAAVGISFEGGQQGTVRGRPLSRG